MTINTDEKLTRWFTIRITRARYESETGGKWDTLWRPRASRRPLRKIPPTIWKRTFLRPPCSTVSDRINAGLHFHLTLNKNASHTPLTAKHSAPCVAAAVEKSNRVGVVSGVVIGRGKPAIEWRVSLNLQPARARGIMVDGYLSAFERSPLCWRNRMSTQCRSPRLVSAFFRR